MSKPTFLLLILGFGFTSWGQPGSMSKRETDFSTRKTTIEENRFEKIVLSTQVEGPIELAVAKDGNVYFIERKGKIKRYDPATGRTVLVGMIPVVYAIESGLIGMALDPDFENNHWIYLLNTRSVKQEKRGWGDPIEQYLSRFTLVNGVLDERSEKVLLKIPVEWQDHLAGSLEFDKAGNLYVALGDNTAFTFYSAERSQRTSANTNNLRGKILRIHPEKDGTYSIPEGNLFHKNSKLCRPEIYVMGCRNPYRLSIDPVSQYLYFSDVGPDASADSLTLGPKGYDEINLVKEAGNFGWPYFTGNNSVYPRKDSLNNLFYTDTLAPVNYSPENTGLKVLPPARRPLVWYPYSKSPDFPVLGYGARTAIIGPVYNYQPRGKTEFPKHYDKVLFMADWCRNWFMTVRTDSNNHVNTIEPFLPGVHFDKPIDITFGPDGCLYVLEYGMGESESKGSRLTKVIYQTRNRNPIAVALANRLSGAAPLRINFSAGESYDKDSGDYLKYKWFFPGGKSDKKTPAFTFNKPGTYTVTLQVTDKHGASSKASLKIQVGNTAPEVKLSHTGKDDFLNKKLCYNVAVTDKEDAASGGINRKNIRTQIYYLKPGEILTPYGTVMPEKAMKGRQLITTNDCGSCHSMGLASQIGPGFLRVSKKYTADLKTERSLALKIIQGGKGVWGDHAMPPHDGLSTDDAEAIVSYILNLGHSKKANEANRSDCLDVSFSEGGGKLILISSYTDKGGMGLRPLKTSDTLILQSPKFFPVDFREVRDVKKDSVFTNTNDGGYAKLPDVDLTAVDSIRIRYSPGQGGRIEIRVDSVEGKLLQTLSIPLNTIDKWHEWFTIWNEKSLPIRKIDGRHDLYLVFRNEKFYYNIVNVAWIKFE